MSTNFKRISLFALMTLIMTVCSVLFPAKPATAKVKINKKTVYMAPGDTVKLKLTGTKKKAKWASKKKKIATVSQKGKVKAKKTGTTTITARIKGKKLKCKIIVENKNRNRARKLREYVLKKGKYNKTKKAYELKWMYTDNSNNSENAVITACKGNNNLLFYHYKDQESSSREYVTMKINLITGNISSAKGAVEMYRDDDVDDAFDETKVFGNITTKYNGKGDGLTLTKIGWTEPDENGDEVYKESEEAIRLDGVKYIANDWMKGAFIRWDEMFSKKYPDLKKKGVSMKSIGFSKWSK